MPASSKKLVLYENTLKLFYKKGFKATTMRDIADSMNFEAASIYNYIESKQSLLKELVFDIADQFLKGIIHVKSSQLLPEDKLKAVINLYVQITSQNPYQAAMLTSEWRNLNETSLVQFEEHRAIFEGHLKDIIREYLSREGQEAIDDDIALHTFLGSVRWIYEWYINNKSVVNPVELQYQLTRLIINGFSNLN